MKYTVITIFIILSHKLCAQIVVDKFKITVDSELSDTLQSIYEDFLNSKVAKVSIVELKKKYSHSDYYHFLKTKKFYQSRKKWIMNNSYEESVIIEGDPYPIKHFDSILFEYKYRGVDKEFIKSEYFLDSTETRLAFDEMFNGVENEIIKMCYNPRHAVLFYNEEGKISGIYEICFECDNVTIEIVGTVMFARLSPYIQSLFEKYKDEL